MRPPESLSTKRLIKATQALLLALAGTLLSVPTRAETSRPDTKLAVPEGYRLVWSDEFAVDGLPDASRWRFDTGRNRQGWHNNEKQYYSAERLGNTRIDKGILRITARREALDKEQDWGGQQYSSARLITAGKAEWTYGFFEVRAKLPCGRGTWPAIWMLGSSGEWPDAGELDILEHVGSNPQRIFSTVHTRERFGDGVSGDRQLPSACGEFHTYQMHWTPQTIRFGVDGAAHLDYRNAGRGAQQWPFDRPQFMILNLAIGGDLGGEIDNGIFPVSMEVDFVRVFQKAP